MFQSYRTKSVNMHLKSSQWFLYDADILPTSTYGHETDDHQNNYL